MKVTAPILAREARVGDIVEVPDGTEGEVTQILDRPHRVVLRIEAVPGLVAPSYHILDAEQPIIAVLEDDGEPMSDVEIYGAGAS